MTASSSLHLSVNRSVYALRRMRLQANRLLRLPLCLPVCVSTSPNPSPDRCDASRLTTNNPDAERTSLPWRSASAARHNRDERNGISVSMPLSYFLVLYVCAFVSVGLFASASAWVVPRRGGGSWLRKSEKDFCLR